MDPRDISRIYFWNPELREYVSIPYRDLSNPSLSIWEYRKVKEHLKAKNAPNRSEEQIFKAYGEMNEIKKEAFQKAKEKRKGKKNIISPANEDSHDTAEVINVDRIEPLTFDE